MATFKALNIESDDELDDEPDNTKEIQIEEALKVYQTALKYHSQGSRTLKEAGEAYGKLFESEIFRYPESLSEHRREETLGTQSETHAAFLEQSAFVPTASAGNAENAPSTLPQILHLSYKNRGQYHLDVLQSQVKKEDGSESHASPKVVSLDGVSVGASRALNDFAEALDKDEDDTDLWRRAARVSSALGSSRISRFCFEAVLDDEEEGLDDIIGGPGIEASVARHDLRKLETHIQDDLSVLQTPEANSLDRIPSEWKKQMRLYSFLSEPQEATSSTSMFALQHATRVTLDVLDPSWNGIGQAILHRLRAEQAGLLSHESGAALELRLVATLPKDDIVLKLSPPHVIETPVRNSLESPAISGSVVPLPEHPPVREHLETVYVTTDGDAVPAIHTGHETNGIALPERTELSLTQGLVGVDYQPVTATLPTRKRSVEAAELPEQGDGGRVRSKRLRARTSIAEDGIQVEGKGAEIVSDYEWKISESVYADNWLFDILSGLANKSGINGSFDGAQTLRNIVKLDDLSKEGQEQQGVALNQAIVDFYDAIQNWSDLKAQVLLRSRSTDDAATDTQKTGLLAFLEHTKASSATEVVEEFQANLPEFVDKVNQGWFNTHELAFFWILTMFAPLGAGRLHRWPDTLKQTIVQMVVTTDEYLSDRVRQDHYGDNAHQAMRNTKLIWGDQLDLVEIVQGLFELHLDIFSRIINPASEVDYPIRLLQRARLDNWCEFARSHVQNYILSDQKDAEQEQKDVLALRHLWTSVFHLGVSDSIERDHFVLCIEDLKREMAMRDNPVIHSPNNAVLPELSATAADREISKLKTMDFFLGIFQKEGKAPVDIIENLEPLLEQSTSDLLKDGKAHTLHCEMSLKTIKSEAEAANAPPDDMSHDATQQVLAKFLKGANVSLRLLLWRRLREAYEAIDYPPKVLSICLRIIEILMNELKTPGYTNKKKEERETLLLDWLGDCSDLVITALALTDGFENALECVDVDHLRSSIRAVLDLWSLLYSVALFDDYSQAGQKGGSLMNPFRFYPNEGFHVASVKFHDMQVKTCLLLYKLFQEAMSQMPESFPNPVEERLQYLRHMHFFFGVRRLCKASDSSFLQFTKDELLNLPDLSRQSSDDLAQVLYDLYDLHCFSTPLERLEHGCDADYLDRKTALQVMDFVMDKVQRLSIKDLLKSDLGKSVEKLHTALGPVKSNTFAAGRNRKLLHVYLRSPLRPIDLFQCLGGIGDLSAVTMSSEDALIASKGWFFLKGDMALAKHRAQRAKGSQGSEDDLHVAIAFFVQDLEYSVDRWESWYRMAQSHDALLEEQVLWSAEKVNSQQDELIQHQRAAIHAYAMAVAGATRTEEVSQELSSTIGELYHDFGTLIYSSTRQPFSMRAFSTRDFPEKHYSDFAAPGGKYTGRIFRSLKTLQAWKLASSLLRRAITHKPHNWLTHYMLGKCLWKIHQNTDTRKRNEPPATVVQEVLFKTIEVLPMRKDTNRQEPILEPIYKVVSVAHKLVQRGELVEDEGSKMIERCLQQQKQFEVSKVPDLADFEDWTSYMIDVLRLLRAADKSRWHHRLVFRAARIMNIRAAHGEGARRAKEYLIDQHMYSTKTLALTVWKPEHERSGRHWCYMKRYALFLAQLLEETDDLEGMETLTRRIRKKTNEYYEHTSLWEELCNLHLKLHRRYGNIPENLADVVFKNVDQEEFAARAALIDTWTSSPKTSHRLQDVLRETAELKKLNAGLMKSTAIDDLLGDAYAAIWTDIGPTLESQKQNTLPTPAVPLATGSIPSSPPQIQDRRSVMSLTNLMNLDGAVDPRPVPTSVAVPAPAAATPLLSALESLPKPRPRLISRREMLKRASDTVTAKPLPPSALTPPPKPLPQPSSVVRVVIQTRQPSNDTSNTTVKEEDVVPRASGSTGSSLHDDADDESELSELEEEEEEQEAVVVRPMLFPNLKSGSQQTTTAQLAEVTGVKNLCEGTGQEESDVNME